MSHRTGILIVLLVFGGLGQIPASAGYVYWTDKDTAKIERARYGATEDVLTAADGLVDPRGIALNVADNWMYWADNGTNKIRRARLDGSEAQDIVTGLSFPADIALDLDAGKIYWADRDRNEIRRANLDGTGPQAVRTGIVQPYYLALDPARGKVYWSDFNSPAIHRANMDGTGAVEDLDFLTGLDRVRDLALDPAAEKIYWGDRNTHKVQRANLDGSGGIEDLYTAADGLDRPHGLALDVGHGTMYWADTSTHKVMQGSTDGSSSASALNPDALSGEPWGVALDLLKLDHSTSIDSRIYGDLHALDGPPGSPPTIVELTEPAYVEGWVEVFGSSTLNITGGRTYRDVIAWDSSHLNIISGDEIVLDDSILARDSSTLTISGGSFEDAAAFDTATLDFLGGTASEDVTGHGSSTVNILSGIIGDDVDAFDTATLNFLGGTASEHVTGRGYSTVNILGGIIGDDLVAYDSCVMNVYGGDMLEGGVEAYDNSRVSISGGLIESLRAGRTSGEHTSLITIAGNGFNYPYGEIPDSAGTLTGTLANGDPINAPFEIYSDASIVLVPEPSTFILLAMGALGLAAYAWRRRQ